MSTKLTAIGKTKKKHTTITAAPPLVMELATMPIGSSHTSRRVCYQGYCQHTIDSKTLIRNTVSSIISSSASHSCTLTNPQMAGCVLCCVVRERVCAYHLLQHVWGFDAAIHRLFGRLLDLSPHQELIQDEVSLLEVKDDVQLAHLRGDAEAEGENHGDRRTLSGQRRSGFNVHCRSICPAVPRSDEWPPGLTTHFPGSL